MNTYARYVIIACSLVGTLHADQLMKDSTLFQKDGLGVGVVSGSLDLPSAGLWTVDYAKADALTSAAFSSPEEATYRQFEGDRMGEVMLERSINLGRSTLSSFRYMCARYARDNEGVGPATFADLGTHDWSPERIESLPWDDIPEEKRDGPFAYWVPSVRFELPEDGNHWLNATNRTLLAIELHPYLDDGKHWVCYADDHCVREEISAERLKKFDVEIRPLFTRKELFPDAAETFSYTFDMPVRGDLPDSVRLPLTNLYTGASMELDWDLTNVTPGDESIWTRYRDAQVSKWLAYWNGSRSPVLGAWIVAAGAGDALAEPSRNGRRRGEDSSIFGVMGGQAAVRETLQMRLITPATNSVERTIPIESIEGVKVESHPYEEMLGNLPGGRLALAERVPADRFFVHLGKPESMLPLLNEGADFIAELGSARTGNSIRYYLKDRYLRRFGANEEWLKAILRSGGIKECALMAPDLFFLDGTDVTAISRIANPALVNPMLKLLGVRDLSGGEISAKRNPDGSWVYWAARGDLLIISTSELEMRSVLELVASDGEGSLGKSAEFRYMLTKLPPNDGTRAYVYLSDPFIRRLVSPAVKIAQLRRAETMINLQRLTAAAWLARQDGLEACRDIPALAANGYLPETFVAEGYSLDADLVARSATHGTLADQRPITEVPVELATEAEAKAYEAYVTAYSRFWRQFFDPIALRLDDVEDDALEATVFILPLIDNSIYNGLREALVSCEDGARLEIPAMDPAPVLRLSVNLNEMAWRGVAQALSEVLTQFVFIDPAILDDLGTSAHLLIRDADPVIALGSGDMLGAFGANMGGSQDLFIPLALSVLTRPCVLVVETKNPLKTATYLRNATHSSGSDWEISSEFYQVGDEDKWVCLFDVMGAIRLRYGLEVKGNHLLIRNIPWSGKDEITSTRASDLNALALRVMPGAVKLQLPGLHSTAAEKNRVAALQGMGLLYPFVAAGATVEEARATHMKLFGHAPYVPAGDQWVWRDGVMESELYGSVFRKKQPAHVEDHADFGLLGAIEFLDVSSQFEESGYRARIRWKMRDK